MKFHAELWKSDCIGWMWGAQKNVENGNYLSLYLLHCQVPFFTQFKNMWIDLMSCHLWSLLLQHTKLSSWTSVFPALSLTSSRFPVLDFLFSRVIISLWLLLNLPSTHVSSIGLTPSVTFYWMLKERSRKGRTSFLTAIPWLLHWKVILPECWAERNLYFSSLAEKWPPSHFCLYISLKFYYSI